MGTLLGNLNQPHPSKLQALSMLWRINDFSFPFLLKVQGQENWSLRDTIVPLPLW
jgi:hypothetical protein